MGGGGEGRRIGGIAGSSGGHQLWLNADAAARSQICRVEAPGMPAMWTRASILWPCAGRFQIRWHVTGWRVKPATQSGWLGNHDVHFLTEAAMAEANPETILERGEAKNLPPALLIQGTADNNVTPDMADRFVTAYAKAGGRDRAAEVRRPAAHLLLCRIQRARPRPRGDRLDREFSVRVVTR